MSGEHDVRTEKVDVDPGSIRRAGLWLVGVTVGAMIVLVPLMTFFEDRVASRESETRPLAFEADREPPAPRLQSHPTLDLEALRAEEDAILGSYAWGDRDHEVVQLPIERAMDLVVERGLPATAPMAAPPASPAPARRAASGGAP